MYISLNINKLIGSFDKSTYISQAFILFFTLNILYYYYELCPIL